MVGDDVDHDVEWHASWTMTSTELLLMLVSWIQQCHFTPNAECDIE